jgi:hypothetical protein
MFGIYFYNKNEHTHLCSLTPSYYLRFIGHSLWVQDGVSDEEREHLYEKYADEPGESTYRDVRTIDAIPAQHKRRYGWARKGEEGEEEVREYFQSNSPF